MDDQKIKYEVEKLRIVYWDSQLKKQRIAIPDFYLPDKNEIIEIKSTWTYDEQNMKDKFKAYKEHGYNYKLILNHKVSNLIMQCWHSDCVPLYQSGLGGFDSHTLLFKILSFWYRMDVQWYKNKYDIFNMKGYDYDRIIEDFETDFMLN